MFPCVSLYFLVFQVRSIAVDAMARSSLQTEARRGCLVVSSNLTSLGKAWADPALIVASDGKGCPR